MKTREQLKPNFAPVYAAALYPELCAICHKHGYALAVHGSLARDFDLIAVPWGEVVSRPFLVLDEIVATFDIRLIGKIGQKLHRRTAHTLSVGFGQCFVDLSFLPTK